MYKKQETIFNTQAEFKHNCNGAKVVVGDAVRFVRI